MALTAMRNYDNYTFTHMVNVSILAMAQARALGIDGKLLREFGMSALMHDIGKVRTPKEILNKPGKLTDEEFSQMRLHPVHGARILSQIQSDKVVSILPGVKYHHERWDGKGYPEGLKGEEIPMLGRVLGVADFLDALSSDRSYRKGLTLDEALAMVKDLEGKAFDPVVVKAAVELHEKGDLALPTTPNPEVAMAAGPSDK
jgi:putative nucleotidyltransferase with HDIG domain